MTKLLLGSFVWSKHNWFVTLPTYCHFYHPIFGSFYCHFKSFQINRFYLVLFQHMFCHGLLYEFFSRGSMKKMLKIKISWIDPFWRTVTKCPLLKYLFNYWCSKHVTLEYFSILIKIIKEHILYIVGCQRVTQLGGLVPVLWK